ncbi:MinD/ParA family protein [Oceanobacillus sp. FSL K6-2867]|uniref:MinD/ParA family protein n=1 Tax=Oceanobacillus sp. FSL K6-2867 TaxID=2954748 RepID=UPI0030DAEBC1
MKHDQAEGLRRKLDRRNQSGQAKTLAVISGKGGVGKSNFALNFSLQLINNGKKILLIDLDVGMGNIDILLGNRAEKTIVNLFEERLSIHEVIEQGPNGLSYIAGGSGLSNFFQMDESDRSYFYEQYMELAQTYDYILFDMGAGVTEESLFFILASDECIVITTPEPTSVTDAYGMIKHVVNRKHDMRLHVILNRAPNYQDGLKSLERFKAVVTKFLHVKIHSMGIIPDDKVVAQAIVRQIPYTLYNEKSKAAKALKEITYNYVTQTKQVNRTTSSFVQRLKQLMEM